ncbi:hypothetical protein N0V93_008415 [Gnomoniopsis smithogilvyi]|uniref:Carboxylic ester hydrolase n=1 Tax=Gnomoniopsis smithogilvyi TaxID=1191159 RepID=A0A9W9CUR3_9PEZI|nr:hypothetical protein N0V93_008415 [Gnomoniopsis smithogilvyi]
MHFSSLTLLAGYAFQATLAKATEEVAHVKRQSPTPAASACTTFQTPTIPGVTVVSVQAARRQGVVVNTTLMGDNGPQRVPPLDICDVNVTLSHGTSGDRVRVEVWMPLNNWNGRFQATGGGGFVAGTFGQAMAPQVAAGFAASSTDAGIPAGTSMTGVIGNQQLYQNFQSLSVHEMALVGKDIVRQFYGRAASFSYWNGCSTGGRQGYVEAEVFPTDFNGILAAAPAINFNRFSAASLWPTVAQASMGGFMDQCTFQVMRNAHIAACDVTADDSVRDGIIQNPFTCNFNVMSMVGAQATGCASGTITAQQASAYASILAGPRAVNGTQLWYGWLPGTNFTLGSAASWTGNFIVQQAGLSNGTINAANFEQVFDRSVQFFNNNLSATNANLTPFKNAGGKLLTWHGLYDNMIFPSGTLDYHQRVINTLGGANNVDSFYRVFEAPGVGHCGNGVGPVPLNPINSLVDWVERGIAPETLPAMKVNGSQIIRRNVCRVGFSPRFMGGDANVAQSWTCQSAQQNFTVLDADEGGLGGSTTEATTLSSKASSLGHQFWLAIAAGLTSLVYAL